MSEFVNTIALLGDDAVVDSIIERTITEFKDNAITSIGASAFCDCTALESVVVPNVEIIDGSAFQKCSLLTEVIVPKATFYNKNYIFDGCANLKYIDLSGALNLSGYADAQYGQYVFRDCTSLEKIIIYGRTGQAMFQGCTSLKIVDVIAGNMNGYTSFFGCTALKALILRQTDKIHSMGNAGALNVCTPFQSGTAYIYVPRSLMNTYVSATNWSAYSSQFRALEDYTVDGTVTGALDEARI